MNIEQGCIHSAIHYVQWMREARTVEQAFDAFQRMILELNFIGYVYADNIDFGQIGGEAGLMSNTMPEAWMQNYSRKGYVYSDPVLEWCMGLNPSATWVTIGHELEKENHQIWSESKQYGLVDGLAFPFFFTDKIGLVSLASHKKVQPHTFALGNFLARYLVASIHFLSNGATVPTRTGDDRFTASDLKLLSLYKSGFTDKQIAEFFEVNRSTVSRHLNRLKKVTFTKKRSGPAQLLDWCALI